MEIATNIGSDGQPKTFTADGDDIDRTLWDLLPILGVRNDGAGDANVYLSGQDGVGTNTLSQSVE